MRLGGVGRLVEGLLCLEQRIAGFGCIGVIHEADHANQIAAGNNGITGGEIAVEILLINGDRFRILVRIDILDRDMAVRLGLETVERFRCDLEHIVFEEVALVREHRDLDVAVELMQIIDCFLVDLIETAGGQVDVPVEALIEQAADDIHHDNDRDDDHGDDRRECAVLQLLAALDGIERTLLFLLRRPLALFLLRRLVLILRCGLILCIFLQRGSGIADRIGSILRRVLHGIRRIADSIRRGIGRVLCCCFGGFQFLLDIVIVTHE